MSKAFYDVLGNHLLEEKQREIAELKREVQLLQSWSVGNISAVKHHERLSELDSYERLSFELIFGKLPILRFSLRPTVRTATIFEPVDMPVYMHEDTPEALAVSGMYESLNDFGVIFQRHYWFLIEKSSGDAFTVSTGAQFRNQAVLPRIALSMVVDFLREVIDEYTTANFIVNSPHSQLDAILQYLGLEELVRG